MITLLQALLHHATHGHAPPATPAPAAGEALFDAWPANAGSDVGEWLALAWERGLASPQA